MVRNDGSSAFSVLCRLAIGSSCTGAASSEMTDSLIGIASVFIAVTTVFTNLLVNDHFMKSRVLTVS